MAVILFAYALALATLAEAVIKPYSSSPSNNEPLEGTPMLLQDEAYGRRPRGTTLQSQSQPTGIHLAFSGPGSISLMWSTRRPTSSSVRWAHATTQTDNMTIPLTNQSGGSSVCPACAQYGPGGGSPLCQWHHTVLLSGLVAGEAVVYQAGDAFAEVWSPRLSFTAPHQLAADEAGRDSTFTAAFFADMGWQSVSDVTPGASNGSTPSGCTVLAQCGLNNNNASIPNQVMPWLLRRQDSYDFLLHAGDIAYADNVPGEDYDLVWDNFMEMVAPLASRVPYMVTPGNHEYVATRARAHTQGIKGARAHTHTHIYIHIHRSKPTSSIVSQAVLD